MMEKVSFSNKDVAKILNIEPRQVLSWTEKGLVAPYRESIGSGTRRGYDYVNLLELSLSKTLYSMGIGFRAIKKILGDLRNNREINRWTENFSDFYKENNEKLKTHVRKVLAGNEANEFVEKYLEKNPVPAKPVGVLVYIFREKKSEGYIVPWPMRDFFYLESYREKMADGDACILVNLGGIRETVDQKI